MTDMPPLSRRSFVASVDALGGGLALGFNLPTGAGPAQAAAGTTEVNAAMECPGCGVSGG